MSDKTILILGGGIGGIVTARELRRHLGAQHRILVVDRNAVHSFAPSFLWVVVGWRKPESIQKPLTLLEKYGIEFHNASVRSINIGERKVETDKTTIAYDYLVVALGAEPALHLPPGLQAEAHSFCTLDQAIRLREQLKSFTGGTIAFIVVDPPDACPLAPYEGALLLDSFLLKRGTHQFSIQLFTPEISPLSSFGPSACGALRKLVEERGIRVRSGLRLTALVGQRRELVFENSNRSNYDLLIAIPRHRAPRVVLDSNLAEEGGWIPVEVASMCTKYPNVFALGDIAAIELQGGGLSPKVGTFALSQAEVVAYNIYQDIKGDRLRRSFQGNCSYFIETGNGRAAYMHGNFLEMPLPAVTLSEPSVAYHWGKVMFEKYWLWRWF